MDWDESQLTDKERECLAQLTDEQREYLATFHDLPRETQAALLKLLRLLVKRQKQPLTADEINRCVTRFLALGVPFKPLADVVAALESGPSIDECTCRTCDHPAGAHVGGSCLICEREGCWS